MLRVISHKVAQLLPERYPGEHVELQDDAARDAANQRNDNYFIRTTYSNGSSVAMEDGGTTPEEVKSRLAPEDMQSEMELGAISIDIVDSQGTRIENIWEKEVPQEMAQPMYAPF